MEADPNEAIAAFAEYATAHLWVASHMTQLLGVALMVAALLFLSQQLESVSGTGWSRVAAGGAIASLAVAAALQAVDGIALKVMVDAWAAAPPAQKEVTFYGAFAVRQLEIGLASMLSLSFGLTMTVYGLALLVDRSYPKWMGGLAIVGGVPTRGRRDGIYRLFWAGDGDQYARELRPAGVDAQSWSIHVAPRRRPTR
jgi:hypothetical protein